MKKFELLLNFFGIKLVFLGLPKISNLSVLQKGLLLQDWVFRLGKFLLHPKSHFLSLDKLIYGLVFFSKNYMKIYKKKKLTLPGFEPRPIRLGAARSTN